MISVARDLLDVLFAGVWQGACIWCVVAAALAFSGYRINAGTRCVVLQATLAAIALVPLATTLPHVMPQAIVLRVDGITTSSFGDRRRAGESAAIAARRIDVVLSDRAITTFTAAWLCGVFFFAVRIAAGSLQLARLAKRSRSLTSRSAVEVLVSPDIGVPLAMGFARPAIIVPASLAAPGTEMFECIVLHELAHVRRYDTCTNACAWAIHALLYFNPAVLLLLRAIALEREIACDDWAIAQSRDLVAYTRSLASSAVRLGARAVASCAAPGFAHATLTRIHRLEDGRRNGATSLSHYAFGGYILVLFTIALTLNSFAPAIAFASQEPLPSAIVATTACASSAAHYINGPAPMLQARVPKGLKTLVRVRVSSTGKAVTAVLYKSSGDASFDRAVLTAAKQGAYAPEMRDCRPLAGLYVFEASTG